MSRDPGHLFPASHLHKASLQGPRPGPVCILAFHCPRNSEQWVRSCCFRRLPVWITWSPRSSLCPGSKPLSPSMMRRGGARQESGVGYSCRQELRGLSELQLLELRGAPLS